jgi:hypothetical protein
MSAQFSIDNLSEAFAKLSLSSPEEKVTKWLEGVNSRSSESQSNHSIFYAKPAENILECPCWEYSGFEIPYCRIKCPFQLSQEYEKICQCDGKIESNLKRAFSCENCIRDIRCKYYLVRALTAQCSCLRTQFVYNSKKGKGRVKRASQAVKARDCVKCIKYVKQLLKEGNYPTCWCKDKNSTNISQCRPYCRWRVNDIYKKWFWLLPEEQQPQLTVWQKAEKSILPTCECWEPYRRAECTFLCKIQLSTQCYELYQESCACNKNALHKIADEYCWVYRCQKCKPRSVDSNNNNNKCSSSI